MQVVFINHKSVRMAHAGMIVGMNMRLGTFVTTVVMAVMGTVRMRVQMFQWLMPVFQLMRILTRPDQSGSCAEKKYCTTE